MVKRSKIITVLSTSTKELKKYMQENGSNVFGKESSVQHPKILASGPSWNAIYQKGYQGLLLHCLRTSRMAEGKGSSEISDAHRDAIREGLYDDEHQPFASGEGRPPGSSSSFVEDAAKDGIKKVVETVENVGDTPKKTLDGAWRAAKDTAQGIKERVSESDDEIRKVDQPLDTQEYRTIEEMKKLEENHTAADHKAH